MTLKGDVIKEYLERFPTTPSLTLAKKIFNEQKDLFKDVENAREIIRYHRGKHGNKNRNQLTDKRFTGFESNNWSFNRIPKGEKELGDYENYNIKGEHVLLLGDIHCPYHDEKALITALKHGKKEKIDTIILLGDFVDFYNQSRFLKDPRQRNLKYEVETSEYLLEIIRDIFPDQDIIWKLGNHDERYEIQLQQKTPEYFDIEHFSYEEIFHINEYNVEIVKDKRILKFGKYLNLLHGHELPGGVYSPVNPARTLFTKTNANAVMAHLHRSSSNKEKAINDKIISTWSIGCLCQLHPKYMPINKWNLGFARITRNKDQFSLFNYGIVNNEIYMA